VGSKFQERLHLASSSSPRLLSSRPVGVGVAACETAPTGAATPFRNFTLAPLASGAPPTAGNVVQRDAHPGLAGGATVADTALQISELSIDLTVCRAKLGAAQHRISELEAALDAPRGAGQDLDLQKALESERIAHARQLKDVSGLLMYRGMSRGYATLFAQSCSACMQLDVALAGLSEEHTAIEAAVRGLRRESEALRTEVQAVTMERNSLVAILREVTAASSHLPSAHDGSTVEDQGGGRRRAASSPRPPSSLALSGGGTVGGHEAVLETSAALSEQVRSLRAALAAAVKPLAVVSSQQQRVSASQVGAGSDRSGGAGLPR